MMTIKMRRLLRASSTTTCESNTLSSSLRFHYRDCHRKVVYASLITDVFSYYHLLCSLHRYGYQVAGNGRWVSLALKKPKKKAPGGRKAKKAVEPIVSATRRDETIEGEDDDEEVQGDGEDDDEVGLLLQSGTNSHFNASIISRFHRCRHLQYSHLVLLQCQREWQLLPQCKSSQTSILMIPILLFLLSDTTQCSAFLKTLYICKIFVPFFTTSIRPDSVLIFLHSPFSSYGGIYERGAKEYTLDDFYTLNLEKLDKFVCLKESGIMPEEGANDESEEDDDDDDDDDDESESDEEGDGDGEEDGDGDGEEDGEGREDEGREGVEVSESGAQDAENEEVSLSHSPHNIILTSCVLEATKRRASQSPSAPPTISAITPITKVIIEATACGP